MTDVSIFAALVVGVISFLSPCVLPLVPGYLAFEGLRKAGFTGGWL
jgi:cytochrome c-type biogenesis protein